MNAITTTTMPLHDMQTLAVAIAKSGLFGIRTPEQALVLMAIAQAEGRHPVEAARDYDIINGKPAKKAEAMLRDFILAGGTVKWNSLTDDLADATFTHPQTGEVRIDWDMKRAQTAFGKKDMYSKFPRQMLRSRVVSEGVRTLWPLATSGMYEPGEQADIQAKDEHTGPTIEPDTRDALNDAVPLKAVAANTPKAPVKRAPVDAGDAYQAPPPPVRTRGQFLDALSLSIADALREQDAAEAVDRIICGPEVERAKAEFRNGNLERLNRIIKDALKAITPPEDDQVGEIVGEKYAAG